MKSNTAPYNYDIINIRPARQSIRYFVSADYVFNIFVYLMKFVYFQFIPVASFLYSYHSGLCCAKRIHCKYCTYHADRSPCRQRERERNVLFYFHIFHLFIYALTHYGPNIWGSPIARGREFKQKFVNAHINKEWAYSFDSIRFILPTKRKYYWAVQSQTSPQSNWLSCLK